MTPVEKAQTPSGNAAAPTGNTGTTVAVGSAPAGVVTSNKVVVANVNVVRASNTQSGGVVSVVVPKGTAGTSAGFSITIPSQVITASNASNQEIKISLVNNAPAPSWIKFSPETKSFSASAMPAKSLPIKLVLKVGNYRTVIELSESTMR
jgi:hypothetical protein